MLPWVLELILLLRPIGHVAVFDDQGVALDAILTEDSSVLNADRSQARKGNCYLVMCPQVSCFGITAIR